MRETYIDEIDNIKRIDAFVSYDEYVESEAFKKYAEEHDLVIPVRAGDVWREKEKAEAEKRAREKALEEEKNEKSAAPCAIATAILALAFIVWCLIGRFVHAEVLGFDVFGLYDGKSFIELVTAVIKGSVATDALVATILVGVGLVAEIVFGLIGSLITTTKKRTSAAVTVATLVAFFVSVGVGVTSVVKSGTSGLGTGIMVLLALATFTASVIGRRNKTEENK